MLFFTLAGIASAQIPDLILVHGKILTVDAQDSVVEAVAIRNGKIVAVGSTVEIQRNAGPDTRICDLHGLTATPFGTGEAIDVHTALRSYTAWAARQLFLEDRIGTIQPGHDADIAVWDRDPYTTPTRDIKNLKCVLTIFAGRIVYQDAAAGIAVGNR